jgi:hypothetical protein
LKQENTSGKVIKMAKPEPIKIAIVYNNGDVEHYECEMWGYVGNGAIEVTPLEETLVGIKGSKLKIKKKVIPFTSIRYIVFT